MAALVWPRSRNENESDREYFTSLSLAFINAGLMEKMQRQEC